MTCTIILWSFPELKSCWMSCKAAAGHPITPGHPAAMNSWNFTARAVPDVHIVFGFKRWHHQWVHCFRFDSPPIKNYIACMVTRFHHQNESSTTVLLHSLATLHTDRCILFHQSAMEGSSHHCYTCSPLCPHRYVYDLWLHVLNCMRM